MQYDKKTVKHWELSGKRLRSSKKQEARGNFDGVEKGKKQEANGKGQA